MERKKDLAAGEDINDASRRKVAAAAKQCDTQPADVHSSGDLSARPKLYSMGQFRGVQQKSETDLSSTSGSDDGEEEGNTECTRKDIEHTFSNLYCYSNLLQSLADDNDLEHFRFAKFIQQVEHKQSELIRVSEALPECTNLAIDLAYNCVVTASYMNLMFSWDSGKQVLVEEISQLALSTARHMLEFAHSSHAELVPDCVEAFLVVMQKFCLTTVVSQINHLPNLTEYQKKVLAKVQDIIDQLDDDSSGSFSTLDINLSSDSSIDDAVKEAHNFGRDAYVSAEAAQNTNNNADTDNTEQMKETPSKQKISVDRMKNADVGSADMDDIILFTKCNPYASIWKLYTDNADIVALFKINNSLRQPCIDTLPDCFKIIKWLEEMAYNIVGSLLAEECEMVNCTFHSLQDMIGCQSPDENSRFLLHQIVKGFKDMGGRYDALTQQCENNISQAIDEMKSDSTSGSSSEAGSEGDDEEVFGAAASNPEKN